MDEKPIIVRYFLFHYWCSLLFSFLKLFSSFLSASAIHSFTFGLLTPCFLTRVHLAFDFGLSVLNCLFSVSSSCFQILAFLCAYLHMHDIQVCLADRY